MLTVLRFLPWRSHTQEPTPTQGQIPAQPLNSFAELMAEQRAQAPAFRPARVPNDTATRAQIDGLIAALWLLDGFLAARRDIALGHNPRISQTELTENRVTPEHFEQQRVDFAWRRFTEHQVKRCRALLQAAAPLGKPWLTGARYRRCIARTEQVLRRLQLDPALAYLGDCPETPWAKLTASARIAWRVISKRR